VGGFYENYSAWRIWIGLKWLSQDAMSDCCEGDNKSSNSLKDGGFFGWLQERAVLYKIFHTTFWGKYL
jgi:hypothetical protein